MDNMNASRQAHSGWRCAAFPAGMIAGLQSRNFQFPDSIRYLTQKKKIRNLNDTFL
jgi:hypothetical protein